MARARSQGPRVLPAARSALDLKHAQLAAFGANRRARRAGGPTPTQVAELRESGAPVVTLVAQESTGTSVACGPRWRRTCDDPGETRSHMRGGASGCFLDDEHFFDGYNSAPGTRVEVVRAATEAGAEVVVL